MKMNKYKAIIGLLFFIVLVQCSTKILITDRDDYILLDERTRLEYEYSIHEGIKFKLFGDIQRALYFFERSIELFPYSDLAYYELSDIYYSNNQIETAIEYSRAAIDIDPGNIWYYYQLARIYRENDYRNEAIEIYRRAIDNFTENYDIYYSLAALYIRDENFVKALEVYNELEEIIGVDEKISVSREQVFMETGEYERAYNELQKLIDNFPGEPRYYGMLAELYTSIGMYREALDNYQKLFRIDPENGIAQLSVAEFFLSQGNFEDAFIYLITAFRNNRLGTEEKLPAMNFLLQNSDIIQNYGEKVEQLGEILIEEYPENIVLLAMMSDFFLQAGNYEKAGIHLQDLYIIESDNEIFAEQLINVLSINQDYDRIIDISEGILERYPENLVINYFVGVAYHQGGKVDEAIDLFASLNELDNITTDIKVHVYTYLGDIFFKKEEYDRSFYNLQKAIDLDSNNMIALNNYAYYLALREEKLDLALGYSLKTINQEPENSSFLDTYAWILFKKGDFKNALKYIELAYINGGDNSYEILKHYAEILIKLDRISEARRYLKKAELLADDTVEIEKLIKSLE